MKKKIHIFSFRWNRPVTAKSSGGQEMSEEKLRKRYRCCKVLLCLLLLCQAVFCYYMWDYLVLKILVSEGYIFTDTLDQVYTDALGENGDWAYHGQFDPLAAALVLDKIRQTGGDPYTYLYNPTQYIQSKQREKTRAQETEIREISSDTVYLRLPNISKYTRKMVEQEKEILNQYDYLILDLRGNLGGTLSDMYKLAELFLPIKTVVAYEQTRFPLFSRTVQTGKGQYFQFEQIIVLQDGNTASAAEGLTMALKENLDHTLLIGTRTYGKGIGQITIPLKNGFAVKATVLKVLTPSMQSIHQKGIEPDILFEEDALSFAVMQIDRQSM